MELTGQRKADGTHSYSQLHYLADPVQFNDADLHHLAQSFSVLLKHLK